MDYEQFYGSNVDMNEAIQQYETSVKGYKGQGLLLCLLSAADVL